MYSLLTTALLTIAWPHKKKHCAWWKKKGCVKPWKESPSHKPSSVPSIEPSISIKPSPVPSIEPTSVPFTIEQLRIAVALYAQSKEEAISEYGSIEDWNTGAIEDFSKLFCGYTEEINGALWCENGSVFHTFNADISKWDVSQGTNFVSMFDSAYQFNGNISDWDVSKAVDMQYMIWNAKAFNVNISGWNIEKVTNMNEILYDATQFNQNLCPWKEIVADTTDTNQMLYGTACTYASNGEWCFSC